MITISEKAAGQVNHLMHDSGISNADHFVRVSVVGGGCSGLSYKMDFDNEMKKDDQIGRAHV